MIMPWTVSDVDRFKRGLSEEQKRRWVAIANGALSECLEQDGADDLECEVRAVRIANATVEGKEKAAALALADKPNPLHRSEEMIHVALAEASEGEYQLAFPVGLFKTGKYGEMIITRTFCERMVDNWQRKVLGERNVFMDLNHEFEEAAAWARDMRVSDDGLEVAWEFNSLGRELVSDKRYRYYSAAIGPVINIDTGDMEYPVLHAVSLTNCPVMHTMPAAHLSETVDAPAHGDGENDSEEESMKTLAEVIEALSTLPDEERGKATDEERGAVATALGMELADASRFAELETKLALETEKAGLLAEENRELAEAVNAYRAAEKQAARDKVIDAALAEGKILPKTRARWERLYDADPEGTEALLAEKAKEIDYQKGGTSRGGEAVALTDEDRAAARYAGMSEEEYIKYSKGE